MAKVLVISEQTVNSGNDLEDIVDVLEERQCSAESGTLYQGFRVYRFVAYTASQVVAAMDASANKKLTLGATVHKYSHSVNAAGNVVTSIAGIYVKPEFVA